MRALLKEHEGLLSVQQAWAPVSTLNQLIQQKEDLSR
jgi:hypothetical protein